jgi:hypothetical protein
VYTSARKNGHVEARRPTAAGADAGIGEAFARASSARGTGLFFAICPGDRLLDCTEWTSYHGIDCTAAVFDLTIDHPGATLRDRVNGEVDLFVNNAGFAAQWCEADKRGVTAFHLEPSPTRTDFYGTIGDGATVVGFYPSIDEVVATGSRALDRRRPPPYAMSATADAVAARLTPPSGPLLPALDRVVHPAADTRSAGPI